MFEPAQIIAVVGDTPILAGDILPEVARVLAPYEGKVSQSELDAQRPLLMQKILKGFIETKTVYLDFLKQIPEENLPMIQEKVAEQFYEKELKDVMKQYGTTSAAELDAKLREYGSSIKRQEIMFGEKLIAREQVRRNVQLNEVITHDDMLTYYHKHEADFSFPAKTRWEHLMTRFDSFPDKASAYRELAEMGNEVLRGAPLAEVAKRRSQGWTASDGGLHDWTIPNSLKSEVLNKAVFSLPVGRLSRIMEDEDGFHIVRVIERKKAGRVSFVEAQAEIKEKIRKERLKQQFEKYLARVQESTYVWTIFDDPEQSDAPGPGDSGVEVGGRPYSQR